MHICRLRVAARVTASRGLVPHSSLSPDIPRVDRSVTGQGQAALHLSPQQRHHRCMLQVGTLERLRLRVSWHPSRLHARLAQQYDIDTRPAPHHSLWPMASPDLPPKLRPVVSVSQTGRPTRPGATYLRLSVANSG
jgi:hypothetical protein